MYETPCDNEGYFFEQKLSSSYVLMAGTIGYTYCKNIRKEPTSDTVNYSTMIGHAMVPSSMG